MRAPRATEPSRMLELQTAGEKERTNICAGRKKSACECTQANDGRERARVTEGDTARNRATYRAPTWRQARWPWVRQQVLTEQAPSRAAQGCYSARALWRCPAWARCAVWDHIPHHLRCSGTHQCVCMHLQQCKGRGYMYSSLCAVAAIRSDTYEWTRRLTTRKGTE